LREKGGRAPGKQPGTRGSTLEQVPDPDQTIECPPACCQGCGGDLSAAPVEAVNARQVFEPPPRPHVTEYRVQARRCGGCGTLTEGQVPAWAAGRAQYGPRAHARTANLVNGNHIPVARAAALMAAMLGVRASTGFVAGARGKAAARLGVFLDRVRSLLRQATVGRLTLSRSAACLRGQGQAMRGHGDGTPCPQGFHDLQQGDHLIAVLPGSVAACWCRRGAWTSRCGRRVFGKWVTCSATRSRYVAAALPVVRVAVTGPSPGRAENSGCANVWSPLLSPSHV
jgi:transposase